MFSKNNFTLFVYFTLTILNISNAQQQQQQGKISDIGSPSTFSIYEKKLMTGDGVNYWNVSEANNVQVCAMLCSNYQDLYQGCKGFIYMEDNTTCLTFPIETERIQKMNYQPEDTTTKTTQMYYNTVGQHSYTNYRMVSIGETYTDTNLRATGIYSNCDGTNVPRFANAPVLNNFPSTIKRLKFESIAYSADTSVLLVCGGTQNPSEPDWISSNECYYIKLIGPFEPNWHGPYFMDRNRSMACSVALKDKIYIFGGGLITNSDVNNNYVEVFDTRNPGIQNASSDLLPYVRGGLMSTACLIAMPDYNAFAVTGGISNDFRVGIPLAYKYYSGSAMYNTNNSSWVSLPDMGVARGYHACGLVNMFGQNNLVVAGGEICCFAGIQTIFFLNLNQLSAGWYQIPGIALNAARRYIRGGIISRLEQGYCDMMFVDSNTIVGCSGNYTWVDMPIGVGSPYTLKSHVPIGINGLQGCSHGNLFAPLLYFNMAAFAMLMILGY